MDMPAVGIETGGTEGQPRGARTLIGGSTGLQLSGCLEHMLGSCILSRIVALVVEDGVNRLLEGDRVAEPLIPHEHSLEAIHRHQCLLARARRLLNMERIWWKRRKDQRPGL